jgi:hypothetical protein
MFGDLGCFGGRWLCSSMLTILVSMKATNICKMFSEEFCASFVDSIQKKSIVCSELMGQNGQLLLIFGSL